MPIKTKYVKQSSSVVHEIITEDRINAVDIKELRKNKDLWEAKQAELQKKLDRANLILAEADKP